MLDLDYSTQQARRYIGWQTEVINVQNGLGGAEVNAAAVEDLFFEHPLYGFGSNLPAQANPFWEGPTPGQQTTLPASLEFENNAITLNTDTRALANSSLVTPGNHPVFAGTQFADAVNYQNPTVEVNLAQVPYLMDDATAATNPHMLDQSNTARVNTEATGGVATETLMPADEADLVNNIDPTPDAIALAFDEIWLAAAGAFNQFFNQAGVNAYPFEELTVVPLNQFFDTKAPEQSNVLPANRLAQ